MRTLILSGKTIKKLLKMEDVLRCVREAFMNETRMNMPPKSYLFLKNGDFRSMPVSYGRYAGIKWVNVHPENKNLPTVMAVFILNDARTGFPLAIMDATTITDFRTGASAGIATDFLSRSDSKVFGIVGCGRQAWTQFLAITLVRNIEKIILYDIKKESAEALKEKIVSHKSVEVVIADDLYLMKECDIISTTTPSTSPVLMIGHIKNGVHINAIGADAPGKQEIDPLILKRARIVVDNMEQAIHSGEINLPIKKGIISERNIYGTLGEIVRGIKIGRKRFEEITLFDSTGLAIQDIAVASFLYERARDAEIGEEIKLIDF